MITHLLDPSPTEIHVFISLQARKPLYVSTGRDSVWCVDGAHIAKMHEPKR